MQKVPDCTKTRKERAESGTYENKKTPTKRSHRSMFEQFMAIKDTIFLSSVLYILIKVAVTFQKSRFYYFEPAGKATPYKAFWKIFDVHWKSTKCHQYLQFWAKKLIYHCSIYVNEIDHVCALPGLRQISVTTSAVIFTCEKSVQGKCKLIQFSFICNRTVWFLYLPILQWSSSLFTDVKLIHLWRTIKKNAISTPSYGNRNVKSID